MISLKDKKIIVSGASGGIGNSIVKKLSEYGADILATGTKIEKLEELKSKYKNINKRSAKVTDFELYILFISIKTAIIVLIKIITNKPSCKFLIKLFIIIFLS